MFYTKSFESEIEAKEFCRTAFGEKYIGELAYGIGIDLPSAFAGRRNGLHKLLIKSKWKYMKSGTIKKIDDFTCISKKMDTRKIYKHYFDFIGVKKDTECSMHKKIGRSEEAAIYNISTICEISGKMRMNKKI